MVLLQLINKSIKNKGIKLQLNNRSYKKQTIFAYRSKSQLNWRICLLNGNMLYKGDWRKQQYKIMFRQRFYI